MCRMINDFFKRVFEHIGWFVASRPITVIIGTMLVAFLLMSGFYRFHADDQIDKLYIPQNSQSMKDLDRGHKHFAVKFKAEEYILKYADNRNVLTRDIFLTALYIHRNITSITGLKDICFKIKLPNLHEQCLTSSPLEIFFFNESLITNIPLALQNCI